MANAGVRGRPIAPVVLSAQERANLERQVRRYRVARSVSEPMSRHSAMFGRLGEQGCGCRARPPRTHSWQVASPIFEGSLRWSACRGSPRPTSNYR